MLSLFASNAADTKMDAANLAIVFSPGILSHPQHRSPVQYRISQRVLEFLIEFEELFTMQLLSAQIIAGSSIMHTRKKSMGLRGGADGVVVVPPVPPLPKNAFVDPRATKSDPLLPLSPQPVRPIPRQLFADIPMDEKTQEKDDTKNVETLQRTIQQKQQSTFSPLVRPRSTVEELYYNSDTTKRPMEINQQQQQDEDDEYDDDISTPRAKSPIQSSSPHLIEQSPPKDLLEELKSIRDTILHLLPGNKKKGGRWGVIFFCFNKLYFCV